ncbi:MAG: hypothetical protein AAF502_16655 [Bacteroidota bacterium]
MHQNQHSKPSIEEQLLGWIPKRYRNEVVVGAALLIVSLSIGFLTERNAPIIKTIPIVVEQTNDKHSKIAKIERKKALLEKNYYDKIVSGTQAFNEKDYKVAITEFFHAKTIYPYEFQPRYLLSKTFYTYCKEEGRYCGNAIKEVNYALAYVPQHGEIEKTNKLMHMDNWLQDYKAQKLAENESSIHVVYGVQNVN